MHFNIMQVTPHELRLQQGKDATLRTCSEKVGKPVTGKRSGISTFFVENGLLWRRYELSRDNVREQVVVPKQFRSRVLRQPHESGMGGHLGVNNTIGRVLQDFYWPAVQPQVYRYVRSCEDCRRTFPKGNTVKKPFGRRPTTDAPFEQVAVNAIRCLSPNSSTGNSNTLTVRQGQQKTLECLSRVPAT